MLTREELAAEVAKLTGSEELRDKLRGSWGALLKPAAALGRLCFAPSEGQQVRFARPVKGSPRSTVTSDLIAFRDPVVLVLRGLP